MKERNLTRDLAREAFAKSGLTFAGVDAGMFRDLRTRLAARLKASGLFDGTFRMTRHCRIERSRTGDMARLYCSAHYFVRREAVTFNGNGFVGFAGWADDLNVIPVLEAFVEWAEAHAPRRAPRDSPRGASPAEHAL